MVYNEVNKVATAWSVAAASVPDKQPWYAGKISRQEAEFGYEMPPLVNLLSGFKSIDGLGHIIEIYWVLPDT